LSFEFSPFTTLPYSKFQRKSEVRIKTKKHEKTDKEPVHIEALDVIREVIYSQVIILKTIVRLSQLRDISIEKLEKKTRFTHPGNRSENVQRNLEKMYGTKLRFIRMDTK
jgi:hypothetical protein